MTRRVFVVERRMHGRKWRPNVVAYEARREAEAHVAWTRQYVPPDYEMRVVAYVPATEREEDGT
jgi:hypothetical protein